MFYLKDYHTIGNINEVDECLAVPILIQNLIGQNILNHKWSWKGTFFRQAFIVFLLTYVFFGTMDVIKDATDDISVQGEGMYTLIITGVFIPRYLIYLSTREQLRKIYLMAKTTLLPIIKLDSEKKMSDLLKKIKLVIILMFVSIFGPISSYLVTALWHNLQGDRVTLSKTTSILMPMETPYYEVGLIIHAIFFFYMAFSLCVEDLWFVVPTYFFTSSCDVLVNKLKVDPKRRNETDSDYATRLNEHLKSMIKDHQETMNYFSALRELTKLTSIMPLVSVLLTCCILMFLMSEDIEWSFLSNFVPVVMENTAINMFGELVKSKVTELNMALLQFDWPSLHTKDKKSYLVIVTYMNKEVYLKSALSNELSVLTMSSVFKASYQVFAVLKSMDN